MRIDGKPVGALRPKAAPSHGPDKDEDPERVRPLQALPTLAEEQGVALDPEWLQGASKEEIIARDKELRAMK